MCMTNTAENSRRVKALTSICLTYPQTVKHLTVRETQAWQNSSSPFSQQTIRTVSMLHSLHKGQDWWKEKNYNPTDL